MHRARARASVATLCLLTSASASDEIESAQPNGLVSTKSHAPGEDRVSGVSELAVLKPLRRNRRVGVGQSATRRRAARRPPRAARRAALSRSCTPPPRMALRMTPQREDGGRGGRETRGGGKTRRRWRTRSRNAAAFASSGSATVGREASRRVAPSARAREHDDSAVPSQLESSTAPL